VVDPLTARFWPAAVGPSGFEAITGHAWVALRWLAIVWTFAAFGEEISYRGYLTTRAADVGGRSKAAYWVSVLLVSVLFGIGHHYKGRRNGGLGDGRVRAGRGVPAVWTESVGLVSWRMGSLIRSESWRSSRVEHLDGGVTNLHHARKERRTTAAPS